MIGNVVHKAARKRESGDRYNLGNDLKSTRLADVSRRYERNALVFPMIPVK